MIGITLSSGRTLKTMLFAGVVLASVAGTAAAWAADRGSGRGRTDGFFASGLGGASVPISTDFPGTEVQVLSLPPGRYIANASAVLTSDESEVRFVDCIFTLDGVIRGELIRGMVGGPPAMPLSNFLSLPLTVGFEIKEPQELPVACTTEIENTVFSQGSPITTIRVDRLIVQEN
jgi:hypothetical protein